MSNEVDNRITLEEFANDVLIHGERSARWPTLPQNALHGLPGKIVRTLAPYTEADPAALLTQLLVAYGNIIGRRPAFQVDDANLHHTNLFVVIVGRTARSRKGTSWKWIMKLAAAADSDWADKHVATGLSSGEGLIKAAMNVPGKELLVVEEEFAKVLRVAEREGNILPDVLRAAWDGGTLRTLTKRDSLKADGAHISIVSHVTVPELQVRLNYVDLLNGFANRYLWVCADQARFLPHPPSLPKGKLTELAKDLGKAIKFGRGIKHPLTWAEEAKQEWTRIRFGLQIPRRPHLLDAATARAEVHILRLAVIYALMDKASIIFTFHLQAAHALWQYAEASVRYIFARETTGSSTADLILKRLRRAERAGIPQNELTKRYPGGAEALALLADEGLARKELRQTKGRHAAVWYPVSQE